MRKRDRARDWALIAIGAVAALIAHHVGKAQGFEFAGWLASGLVIGLSFATWQRVRRLPSADIRRITAASANTLLKTDQRLVEVQQAVGTMSTELGTMRAELSEEIKATGERAAVERAIADTKARQADYDEQQTGRLVEVQQTLAAMGVRLVGISNRLDATFATLRSLPCGQAGDTTLPAQGNEPSDPPSPEPVTPGGPPNMPPSGVHASSNYGSALSASLEPRSWTLGDSPPQSSVEPSEPGEESADDDDETTLFDRSQLPAPASEPKPSSGNPGKMAGWLARRAKARIERAQREREQRDSSSSEAPTSDA